MNGHDNDHRQLQRMLQRLLGVNGRLGAKQHGPPDARLPVILVVRYFDDDLEFRAVRLKVH